MLLIILIFTITTCIHVFFKIKYNYWNTIGVKGPTPIPLVGNFGRLMMQQQTISQLAETIYNQFPKEKAVGLYCGTTPVLLLRDPELINQIMTTDFNNFVNRGVRTAEEGFSNNLLIAEDDTWRIARQKMSSAFTSTKLKQIIPLIHECVNKLIHQIEATTDPEADVDIKNLAAKYSLDLVCSCAFGLSLDSDLIERFNKMGQEIITPSMFFRLWYVAEMIIPGIQTKFKAVDPARHIRRFFLELVTYVINQREMSNEKRRDFMDIMIQFYNQDKSNVNSRKSPPDLTVDVNFIASQAFVFYTAGFETSSSTLSLLLYELSLNESIQDTLYKEICEVLDKNKGELTYETINEMSYLQQVFNETLRKHPVVGFVIRKAAKDYTFPGTNITVKAGTTILISPGGIHNDPKYFADPEKFRPENFSTENLNKIPASAYLPFGIGPRNCVGIRFAKLHIMMATVALLRRFKISPVTSTDKRKIEFDSISITITPVDGIWIKLTRRNNNH